MRAIVYDRYGPPEVLTLRDVPKPEPGPGEVRIHVRATTVTPGDWRMRKPEPALTARLYNGLFRPRRVRILGFEVAGVIDALGQGVTRFRIGDAAFGFCGIQFGGYAEYIVLPERVAKRAGPVLAHKPEGLTFEQAAALPVGGTAALIHLRDAGLEAGQRVLINGASGSVGTYAVQIAKHLGAHVTGVCSGRNAELVASLGADAVIDYTRQDVTALDERFDLVYDAVHRLSRARCKGMLAVDGRYASVSDDRTNTVADLRRLAKMVVNGELRVVIDRQYPLQEIVEAHRYVQQGHKRGNVVINL